MGNGKNKRKHELRSRISYKSACENHIVHQVVYEWLKTTKASTKSKFKLLDGWRLGNIMLLIDFKNLKVTKVRKPEYDNFLRKYVAIYLGVKR